MTPPAFRSALLVSALAAGAVSAVAAEEPAPGPHVEASLVAAHDAVAPGRPLLAGIRLRMQPGWHTYWQNPGDAGLPTRARWTLPEGLAAGELQWPAPERFPTGPLVSYGYSGEVVLPVEIRVPATLAVKEVRLAARVDWLECEQACVPGRAEVALTLPVRAAPGPGKDAALLAAARRRLPAAADGWSVAAAAGSLGLELRTPAGEDAKDAYFYPAAPGVLDHARPQTLERIAARRYRLRLARDLNAAAVDTLDGVLVVEATTGRRSLPVRVPLPPPSAPRPSRN